MCLLYAGPGATFVSKAPEGCRPTGAFAHFDVVSTS